jgi:hypothetical protein
LAALLQDSPSLPSCLEDALSAAYAGAVEDAASETGLSESAFPPACPYLLDRLLDRSFLPE